MSARPELTEPLEALLRRVIREELRGMRPDQEGRRAQQDQPAALVRCIGDQPGSSLPFSVAELLERAEVVPELRAAIFKAVGALNGKKLGKLLKRIEGVSFDGVSIVRAGANREGVLWLCDFETRKPVAAL